MMACPRHAIFPLVFSRGMSYNKWRYYVNRPSDIIAATAAHKERTSLMAKRVMKRRRSWKRTVLMLVVVAGIVYAGAHILIRPPEVEAQGGLEATDAVQETEDLTQEERGSGSCRSRCSPR